MSENIDIKHAEKLEKAVGKEILDQLAKGKVPKFVFAERSAKNVVINKDLTLSLGKNTVERGLDRVSELRPFTQLVVVAQTLSNALREHQPLAKRDVFYSNLKPLLNSNRRLFDDQKEADAAVEDLEVLTGIMREDLNIVADPKGSVAGELKIRSAGDLIDCSKQGDGAWSVPSGVKKIKLVSTNAKFVLVVEKGTVFQRLNSTKWWRTHQCLLITAGGQPDRSTRYLVKRLHDEMSLPIYVLTDADPYGFHIFSVYSVGSVNLAHESKNLTCPSSKFLGVCISDFEKYKIPENCLVPAEKTDLKRASDMLKYPWFQTKFWQDELKLFLKNKKKAEIETLSVRGYKFLADKYLPEKLKEVQ